VKALAREPSGAAELRLERARPRRGCFDGPPAAPPLAVQTDASGRLRKSGRDAGDRPTAAVAWLDRHILGGRRCDAPPVTASVWSDRSESGLSGSGGRVVTGGACAPLDRVDVGAMDLRRRDAADDPRCGRDHVSGV
jgi:hypothetical protein